MRVRVTRIRNKPLRRAAIITLFPVLLLYAIAAGMVTGMLFGPLTFATTLITSIPKAWRGER